MSQRGAQAELPDGIIRVYTNIIIICNICIYKYLYMYGYTNVILEEHNTIYEVKQDNELHERNDEE